MKGRDGRSLRVAVISDALLNGPGAQVAIDAAEADWGLAWLPPAQLGEADAAAWIENVADLVHELRRHGLTAVVLLAGDEPRAALVRSAFGDGLGLPVLAGADEDPDATRAELEALARASTAVPASWAATTPVPMTGDAPR